MPFDTQQFLHQTIDQSNSTEMVPVPEGEYLAMADKVEVIQWNSKDGSKSGLKLQLIWDLQDENVKALLERQKVTARQDIMLDLTDDGTGLDLGKGKNVGLGRLRAAIDMNENGQPFSFAQIQGHLAKVSVKQRFDDNDPTKIYSEVRAVAHA